MTEAEWHAFTNPHPMLSFLEGMASDRKFRSFACACCRRVWYTLNQQHQRLLDLLEQYVDDDKLEGEVKAVLERLRSPTLQPYWSAARSAARIPHWAAHSSATEAARASGMTEKELEQQSALLRDIFGNPFRPPPTLDPAWLRWHDGTIPRLAQQMYDSRDFAAMPILADALEEAGCTSADILDHCRGPGPHVRGCFVVDLILGKA